MWHEDWSNGWMAEKSALTSDEYIKIVHSYFKLYKDFEMFYF